jgi:hypothetical protein
VRITKALLERKRGGSDVENRDYRPWGTDALTTQQISPTSGGRSLGIFSLWTKSHGVFFCLFVVFLGVGVQISVYKKTFKGEITQNLDP